MAKQHQTFPGESQEELPGKGDGREIGQPADPAEPTVPQEDNQVVPDEFPAEESEPGSTVVPPAKPA